MYLCVSIAPAPAPRKRRTEQLSMIVCHLSPVKRVLIWATDCRIGTMLILRERITPMTFSVSCGHAPV